MRIRILVIAALLPVGALLGVLSVFRGSDRPIPETNIPAETSVNNDADEIPSWVLEPIPLSPDSPPDAPWIDPLSFEEIGRNIDQFNDDLYASINQSIADSIESELRPRFDREENVTLPVLPGLDSFELAICPRSLNCLNEQLLSQADDPVWARAMESRIFGELARHPVAGRVPAHVACRQTICGIAFPYAPGAEQLELDPLVRELAESLGFSPYYNLTVDREDLQAIYLTTEVPASVLFPEVP